MRRSSLAKLREITWVKVPGDPLEVGVIPSASGAVGGLALLGAFSEDAKREVCKRMFVNFKNYFEDDGETVILNTIEARVELFDWEPARKAIAKGINQAHEGAAEGEADAASA